MDERPRVLVAGGGISGLALGAALSRLGCHVTVLERQRDYGTQGAHLGVQTGAVLALRAIGADAPVLQAGVEVERYELLSWRGRPLARWSPGEIGRRLGAPSVTAPRQVLVDALRAVVPQDSILTGAQVASFQESTEEVRISLEGGGELSGDVLIGADGLHSVVREQLMGPQWARYAGYVSWRGVSRASTPELRSGTARHALGAGRTLGMWPLPGGRTYWVLTERRPEPATAVETVSKEELDQLSALLDAKVAPAGELLAQAEPGAVLRTPIYDRDPIARWHSARVVLVGDAAHPMQPTTGQGAGQALLDALALATALGDWKQRAGSPQAALARYTTARSAATAQRVADARQVGALHHTRHPAARRLRDVVMRLTPSRIWQERAEAPAAEIEVIAQAVDRLRTREEHLWNDTH